MLCWCWCWCESSCFFAGAGADAGVGAGAGGCGGVGGVVALTEKVLLTCNSAPEELPRQQLQASRTFMQRRCYKNPQNVQFRDTKPLRP